jgi:hypothetical protein
MKIFNFELEKEDQYLVVEFINGKSNGDSSESQRLHRFGPLIWPLLTFYGRRNENFQFALEENLDRRFDINFDG